MALRCFNAAHHAKRHRSRRTIRDTQAQSEDPGEAPSAGRSRNMHHMICNMAIRKFPGLTATAHTISPANCMGLASRMVQLPLGSGEAHATNLWNYRT